MSFRLLFALDGLWVGGTERSVAELLPTLRAGGIDCQVAVLRRCAEGIENEVRAGGTRVHVVSGRTLLGQVRAMRRLLLEESPDLLHTALFRSNLVGRLAALSIQSRPRVLTSIVNDAFDPRRQRDPAQRRKRVRVLRAFDAVSGRLMTDHFHAVSDAAKASAVRDLGLPASRVTVVRRGRDPERLGAPSDARKQESRRRLGLAADAIVIVNVGREDHQKDQGCLLEAASLLLPRHPTLTVVLVGRRGTNSNDLEALIERTGLGEHVLRLGHREDVPDVLAAADLFAFPSLWEGYPGAVIEAMALGLPVVASDIGPHREIVKQGETGTLVPPESVGSLAHALGRLLNDKEQRRTLGRRAREIFLEQHTLARSAESMICLYESLLSG